MSMLPFFTCPVSHRKRIQIDFTSNIQKPHAVFNPVNVFFVVREKLVNVVSLPR